MIKGLGAHKQRPYKVLETTNFVKYQGLLIVYVWGHDTYYYKYVLSALKFWPEERVKRKTRDFNSIFLYRCRKYKKIPKILKLVFQEISTISQNFTLLGFFCTLCNSRQLYITESVRFCRHFHFSVLKHVFSSHTKGKVEHDLPWKLKWFPVCMSVPLRHSGLKSEKKIQFGDAALFTF